MAHTQVSKSEALNLALMYHRQRDSSQSSLSDDDILKVADKFHGFLIGAPVKPQEKTLVHLPSCPFMNQPLDPRTDACECSHKLGLEPE